MESSESDEEVSQEIRDRLKAFRDLRMRVDNLQTEIQKCEDCGQERNQEHNCVVDYQEIPCPYCGDQVIRAFLKDHLEDQCISYIEHKFQQFQTFDECVICYTEIRDQSTKLPCQHSFHEICIKEWFKKRQECPLCRDEV